MKPGLHTLDAAQYHQDPCEQPSLSASIAKILLEQSPAHAWANHPQLNPQFERKTEDKYDVGTAAHKLLLEGESVIEVIVADNFRTKVAQEHRDEARAHGRIPLLAAQADEVEAMVDAIRARLQTLAIRPTPFTAGKPEQTIVWDEQGVMCRARLDWLHNDQRIIDDLKTTNHSAHPAAFSRTLYGMGYHIQSRMYQRGVEAVTGRVPDFRFVVVECKPPFALTVFELPPAGVALADKQIDAAIDMWRDCLENDHWPAYPDRICYPEPPGWIESSWLEREAMQEAA